MRWFFPPQRRFRRGPRGATPSTAEIPALPSRAGLRELKTGLQVLPAFDALAILRPQPPSGRSCSANAASRALVPRQIRWSGARCPLHAVDAPAGEGPLRTSRGAASLLRLSSWHLGSHRPAEYPTLGVHDRGGLPGDVRAGPEQGGRSSCSTRWGTVDAAGWWSVRAERRALVSTASWPGEAAVMVGAALG